MRHCGSLCTSLLMAALLMMSGVVPARAQGLSVPFLNGGFEQGLFGWAAEGDASLDTRTPLAGRRSLRLGPGRSAVRQRAVVGGLRVLLFEANLRTASLTAAGALRAQCYDTQNHLLLDLRQEFGPAKTGRRGLRTEIYFKTQARTAYVVVSIEKDSVEPGYVYADVAALTPDIHDRVPHTPLCDLNQFMQPFWQGKTVYAETVLMFSEHGRPAMGRLLFTPTRILSVQDYGQNSTYALGRDYTLSGKTLTATPDTRMPTFRDTEYPAGEYQWYNLEGRHVVVTYTHDDVWLGPTPTYRGDLLPHTLNKLRRHLPLTIVTQGDSITQGSDLSGYLHIPPYMPTWPELFVERLKRVSGNNAIRLYNTALGGATAEWGLENADSTVAALDPDLVILAFGMNDVWDVEGEQFRSGIQGIITRIRARWPNAEFILVSPMRYDPAYDSEVTYRNRLASYVAALQSLAGPGVQFLDMRALSGALYAAKKPKDFVSNPMHPNDFMGRWYAQSLLAMLVRSPATAGQLPVRDSAKPRSVSTGASWRLPAPVR
jgi:lysophospholipase L1-like esterase